MIDKGVAKNVGLYLMASSWTIMSILIIGNTQIMDTQKSLGHTKNKRNYLLVTLTIDIKYRANLARNCQDIILLIKALNK